MTSPFTSPPLGATSADASPDIVSETLAPDAREIGALAAAAVVVVTAHVLRLGDRMATREWTSVSGSMTGMSGTSEAEAILHIAARYLPWLLGLLVVGASYAMRWLPRTHQRLLEPSLVASWVTVLFAAGLAWVVGGAGVWPWTWQTTAPENAVLLAQLWTGAQWIALGAWLTITCLLLPLLCELFFRLALLESLRARGLPVWSAVVCSALAFGALWLAMGVGASPVAAWQQAAVATVAGVALGALAVHGSRGRGLGLCVFANASWMATDAYMLLRTLPG